MITVNWWSTKLISLNTHWNYLFEETISSLNFKFAEYAKKDEEKNHIVFLNEGNTFKTKSKEKAGLFVNPKKCIYEVEAKKMYNVK